MLRPILFSVLFIAFCHPTLSQNYSSDNPAENPNHLEFWNNLRIMPVQFLDKRGDKSGNTYFSAIFASSLVLEKVDFVLPSSDKQKSVFFEQKNQWEEQIDRKTFLKKFKKDFWLTTYLKSGTDNIIISAHQFKQWQSLKISFASHPLQLRRNVDSIDFWQDIRMKVVFFHAFDDNKIYWMFLGPIAKTEPFIESDYKLVPLANKTIAHKRYTSNPFNDFRVLDQGLFYTQKDTVFHKQEIENAKPWKVFKFTITDAKLRLRPLPTDMDYVQKNSSTRLWVCFYDSKNLGLSRVIEAADVPTKDHSK